MRLDKFLSNNTPNSRKEVAKLIKLGQVTIDGIKAVRPDQQIDEIKNQIVVGGNLVTYNKYTYIMLNKPFGVVSATTDNKQKTVLDLLPVDYKKLNLFPCGRLDKDTLGLIILTNNGIGAHKLLSPKNHVPKTYEFECIEHLSKTDRIQLEKGIQLKNGYMTKQCKLDLGSDTKGTITITEGKYHEIKRMFGAIGNKITYLKRISFGSIVLDKNLKEGEFRHLSEQERIIFEQ